MRLKSGSMLGPYQILNPLGAGGMGEVYRARDAKLDREVAIKVLPASLAADQDALSRFEREARAIAALTHPNIRGIHHIGQEGGTVFAAMELLEGESLRPKLDLGPISPKKAVEYALQAAQGLAAAHEKGIVHRDIKPENLFITRDARVKILDFGLARLTRLKAQESGELASKYFETTPGLVVGTLGYLSPEQVRGEEVDARSDIFALGCVLYEMLCGHRPFWGSNTFDIMNAVIVKDLPEVLPFPPDVPPALEHVLRHCLEKPLENRFQSARDLVFSLQNLSVFSTRVSQALQRKAGRTWLGPVRTFAAGLLAGGLVVLGVVALIRSGPDASPTVRYLTYSGKDASPSAAPDGKTIAFTSTRDGKSRIWLKQVTSGDEVALTSGPDTFPRISPDSSQVLFARQDGQGASLFSVSTLGGEPRRLVSDALEGDWSPDGKKVVFVRGVGRSSEFVLGVVPAEGGPEKEIGRVKDRFVTSPRWSPDARQVAAFELTSLYVAVSPTTIQLFDLETSARRVLTFPGTVTGVIGSSLAWSPDSKELVYAAGRATGFSSGSGLYVHTVKSGKLRSLLSVPDPVSGLDILYPGRLVLHTAPWRQNLQEQSLGPDAASRWLTRGSSNDRQPAFSREGEWLIFSSDRAGSLDLWAVSRDSGAVRRLTHDSADDWDPAVTPDGKNLLWSSKRSGNFEIWISDPDGSSARQVTRDGVDAENPAPTPDGWVVYTSNHPERAGLWRIRLDGSEARQLTRGLAALPEVSPDGQHVLFIEQVPQRKLKVVRVSDGSPAGFEIGLDSGLRILGYSLGRARWMPDGKAIAFVAPGEAGLQGVFVQDFVPGKETSATRRPLAGFRSEQIVESFGISADGRWIASAVREQVSNLLLVEGVRGLGSRREKKP